MKPQRYYAEIVEQIVWRVEFDAPEGLSPEDDLELEEYILSNCGGWDKEIRKSGFADIIALEPVTEL